MPEQRKSMIASPTLDRQGFIRVAGVVMGRYIAANDTIQLKDNNKLSIQCRGCDLVEVPVSLLVALLRDAKTLDN